MLPTRTSRRPEMHEHRRNLEAPQNEHGTPQVEPQVPMTPGDGAIARTHNSPRLADGFLDTNSKFHRTHTHTPAPSVRADAVSGPLIGLVRHGAGPSRVGLAECR